MIQRSSFLSRPFSPSVPPSPASFLESIKSFINEITSDNKFSNPSKDHDENSILLSTARKAIVDKYEFIPPKKKFNEFEKIEEKINEFEVIAKGLADDKSEGEGGDKEEERTVLFGLASEGEGTATPREDNKTNGQFRITDDKKNILITLKKITNRRIYFHKIMDIIDFDVPT